MITFAQRQRDSVSGVLNGFDRVRIRGTLRWLCYPDGLAKQLSKMRVLLKDFKDYAQRFTDRVRQGIETMAQAAGRPIEYLARSAISKAQRARAIAERDGRKALADLPRRAQVCQAANERYLQSLAGVEGSGTTLATLSRAVCRPIRWKGRWVRALNPLAHDDARLLAAVNRGEFAINGFRNRDLRRLLYGDANAAPDTCRRHAAAVTRKLRLLRAHGLIRKVPKTHRYTISRHGSKVISALLLAQAADTARLMAAA